VVDEIVTTVPEATAPAAGLNVGVAAEDKVEIV
jgi:hypothetical protein